MKSKAANVWLDNWCDLKELEARHQRQGRNIKFHELLNRILKRGIAAEKRRLVS